MPRGRESTPDWTEVPIQRLIWARSYPENATEESSQNDQSKQMPQPAKGNSIIGKQARIKTHFALPIDLRGGGICWATSFVFSPSQLCRHSRCVHFIFVETNVVVRFCCRWPHWRRRVLRLFFDSRALFCYRPSGFIFSPRARRYRSICWRLR